MSAAARQALADAASTVDGITCAPYFRQSTKSGDASVRIDRVTRAANGFGSMTTWQVVVWLPSGQVDAEHFIDDHLPALLAALSEEGVVTTAQPVQMQIESGSAPALVVEVVRETEE